MLQTHFEDDMAYHEEHKSPEEVIKEKEEEIRDLKDKLSKANFTIAFLQQENRKLQVNQLFLTKPKADLEVEEEKVSMPLMLSSLRIERCQINQGGQEQEISRGRKSKKVNHLHH